MKNNWKDSFTEGFEAGCGIEGIKECGRFGFYVTDDEKEYLDNNLDEIKGMCEEVVGEAPCKIEFKGFWDEVSDEVVGGFCWCYFSDKSTAEETEDYKVGQVVYYSTHFYRTDVKFFKVLNVTSRTLTIVELESKVVEGDPLRTYTVTLDESMKEIGEPFKVYKGKDGVACVGKHGRWNSAFLYEWDGEPKWCNTGYNG